MPYDRETKTFTFGDTTAWFVVAFALIGFVNVAIWIYNFLT